MRRCACIRFFKCPACGLTLTAPKTKGATHAGHVKTMYCYICKADRDFVQTDSEKVRAV